MQISNNEITNEPIQQNFASKLNIEELLFDGFLLLIAAIGRYFFVNEKLITFNEYTSSTMVGSIIAVCLLILFVYIGAVFGRYKEHKKAKKIRFLLFFVFLWLIVSALIPMEDIMRSVENYRTTNTFLIVFLITILLGSLLGFLSKSKSLQKALKIFGITAFIIELIGVGLFIFIEVNHNQLHLNDKVFSGIALLLGVLIFLVFPPLFFKLTEKSAFFRKLTLSTYSIIIALIFSMWDFLTYSSYTDDAGFEHKDVSLVYVAASLVVFRFLVALAPPKNKLNMIIGAVVLIIVLII